MGLHDSPLLFFSSICTFLDDWTMAFMITSEVLSFVVLALLENSCWIELRVNKDNFNSKRSGSFDPT